MNIKKRLKNIVKGDSNKKVLLDYYNRYRNNAFRIGNCKNARQYEACILRLYHTVEKGLSYEDYRAGFGKQNISMLLDALEKYSAVYGYDSEVYRTSLDVLYQYIDKNKKYGYSDKQLETRIFALPGVPNDKGGTTSFEPLTEAELQQANYKEFFEKRHSMRHFAAEPVEMKKILEALKIAQYTPSACNRQGWKSYVVSDKAKVKQVLENQNGNRGFGQEIDKLLLITADLRCFNMDREVFQAFIDGGMYAMSVINSLYYCHIATIPLSASLLPQQEENIRKYLNVDPAEIFILFIGMGSYPDKCQTTKSDRHDPIYTII